jgi:hypothetical protein
MIGLLYFICMFLVKDLYIGTVNFDILTLGFDDYDHLWNLPHRGAFVFHNTSCWYINHSVLTLSIFFLQISNGHVPEPPPDYHQRDLPYVPPPDYTPPPKPRSQANGQVPHMNGRATHANGRITPVSG